MRKEDKNTIVEAISEQLKANPNFYLTDISDLNAENTSKLRRLCFNRDVKLLVVKNSLLRKAMERTGVDMSELYPTLKGATSIMFSEFGSTPAKLIKEFRKTSNRPILKAAFIEEAVYIGDNLLDFLVTVKSKNDLIGDLIALLQSPAKNVIGALQSGGQNLTGILKTLSEKPE
ncbi:MAG: 50S ribosomal protein L10 [Bacteroidales bacterium]|jgi:large subunit ribosomal protein L10|nr:50S ribosomal protein L10 [Bacteroidales bacterium]MCK9449152.1 50S ribosomal protein L10 [Bacteroidales bacterium]MDD2594095.1 50S ribosomal protein L10 [Bacteroidales bacterium]MDD3701458.1 50S ribosomal protein L10 [Bacteroidales bacterium]MDY0369978.1 50S ribosomal protein L10 [Bacteroidales bacterium]